MMAKAVQRDAERVTSTELKLLTQELEQTLGAYILFCLQNYSYPT